MLLVYRFLAGRPCKTEDGISTFEQEELYCLVTGSLTSAYYEHVQPVQDSIGKL